jgi:hypothetical protein
MLKEHGNALKYWCFAWPVYELLIAVYVLVVLPFHIFLKPVSLTIYQKLVVLLILILLTWRIWRAPNNASKW